MQQAQSFPLAPHPQPIPKPLLLSLDSGTECSLDHWIEISWLVEREDEEIEGYLLEDSCFLASH